MRLSTFLSCSKFTKDTRYWNKYNGIIIETNRTL